MPKYPEPIVGAFIRNKHGEVLLVKSYKWGGRVWSVSGGHIKWGETIKHALVREVREELNIDVKFIRVFTIYDVIYPKYFYQKKHFIFFECECLVSEKSQIRIDNREIQETKWFSLSKALKQDVENYTRRALKALREK